MSAAISLVFCGSFQSYSAQILAALLEASDFEVKAVVTTAPVLNPKTNHLTPNPVHQLALDHQLPVVWPTELTSEIWQTFSPTPPDFLVTAGFGRLLPESWLVAPRLVALNFHFSLLPKYRGANPAEWAILAGETETGVSLIQMSPTFDTGGVLAQASCSLDADDTRETVYNRVYHLASQISTPSLRAAAAAFADPNPNSPPSSPLSADALIDWHWPPIAQPQTSPTPYAKRFRREDGFIEWADLLALQQGLVISSSSLNPGLAAALTKLKLSPTAQVIERAIRAFAGFPTLWTLVPTQKGERRLIIHSATINQGKLELKKVQLSGQLPANWVQIRNAIKT